MPTAAFVAEQMNLPGAPLESVETVCNKARFRVFLKENGFPVPQTMQVNQENHPASSCFTDRTSILKPDSSSGSKGIYIISSEDEYWDHLPETLSFSLTGTAVYEEFVEGFQGTVEGVLEKGQLALSFFLDRQTFIPPYVTTVGHHLPTILSHHIQKKVKEQLHEIWHLLDIDQGPFDCDFVATDEEVYILEMAPRLGGNSISQLLRYSGRMDIVKHSVKCACGDTSQLPIIEELVPTAVVLLGVNRNGLLHYNVDEFNKLQTEPWILSLRLDVSIGNPVCSFIDGRYRIGEAFIQARSIADLDIKISEFKQRLDIKAI